MKITPASGLGVKGFRGHLVTSEGFRLAEQDETRKRRGSVSVSPWLPFTPLTPPWPWRREKRSFFLRPRQVAPERRHEGREGRRGEGKIDPEGTFHILKQMGFTSSSPPPPTASASSRKVTYEGHVRISIHPSVIYKPSQDMVLIPARPY